MIQTGAVTTENGTPRNNPSAAPVPGETLIVTLPEAQPIKAQAQNIPLDVIHEDADLIVVNKPVGMVVHPAPGASDATLVNALLYHCKDSLSGIGGALRPGIVHRIDKDTSGLLVVAKTDAAHQGLAAQFAAHSVHRIYDAICWGCPGQADPRLAGLAGVSFPKPGVLKIDRPLARHPQDRKKMAVRDGGKHAITRATVIDPLGAHAAHVQCQLETGRTHQIRVHLSYTGHPLIGDPVYGRNRTIPARFRAIPAIASFKRQALHARELGFVHPVSGDIIRLSAPVPDDMAALKTALQN